MRIIDFRDCDDNEPQYFPPLPVRPLVAETRTAQELADADGDTDGDGEEWITPPQKVIISRHLAAIDFIAQAEGGRFKFCPVITGNATIEDVAGKEVAGNIPLHLAALAACVWAVEFEGQPPRGQEYTATDMVTAGAKLVKYEVRKLS